MFNSFVIGVPLKIPESLLLTLDVVAPLPAAVTTERGVSHFTLE